MALAAAIVAADRLATSDPPGDGAHGPGLGVGVQALPDARRVRP